MTTQSLTCRKRTRKEKSNRNFKFKIVVIKTIISLKRRINDDGSTDVTTHLLSGNGCDKVKCHSNDRHRPNS